MSEMNKNGVEKEVNFFWKCDDYKHTTVAEAFLQEHANGPVYDQSLNKVIADLRNYAADMVPADGKHHIHVESGDARAYHNTLGDMIPQPFFMEMHQHKTILRYAPDNGSSSGSYEVFSFELLFGSFRHGLGAVEMVSKYDSAHLTDGVKSSQLGYIDRLLNLMPDYTRYGKTTNAAGMLVIVAVADHFTVQISIAPEM